MDLRGFESLFRASTYTELRAQENRSINIHTLKGNLVSNNRSVKMGVCSRAYDRGGWGFASMPDCSSEAISRVVNDATSNAIFLGSRGARTEVALPVTEARTHNDCRTTKPRREHSEILEFVREVDSLVATQFPRLASRAVGLACLDMEKSLLTSHGSHCYSMIPRSFMYVSLTVEKDGEPFDLSDSIGGFGQFEDHFDSPADIIPVVDELYRHLMHKKEGVFASAGAKTCILGTKLAGLVAHEAIGHTVEADWVLGGSVASGWMGQDVASPHVTLVDFANTCMGLTCPVPVWADDEGTLAEDAVLIDKGKLNSYMHSKETAARLGMKPTGNARAFEFNNEVEVRMRNTAILPGSSSLDSLIASVDDGYYLMESGNGQADATSEFMFGITLGYEIRNGRLGQAIRDTTVSGLAFDVLKSVDMVSDGLTWLVGGFCGKKTPIPVGLGGPAMRCTITLGGR